MSSDAVPTARQVNATLSSTAIADDYRATIAALRRCAPVAHRFDAAFYSPAVLEAARGWWARMMRTEYESASLLTDLGLQMRQIDAPIDVQASVLRIAQDELRHAELCGGVLAALGAEPAIPAPPVLRAAIHPDCTLEESVLRNVIYGCCLGETVNAARLAKWIGKTTDEFIRETFRQLAADERFHAQFGFLYLETKREWLGTRPDVRRSLARYLRYAFAQLEQYMGANPANARELSEDESAIGLPDLTDVSATFQETIVNACIPGLERFDIDAAAAWRTRTRTQHAPPVDVRGQRGRPSRR